MPPLQQRCAGIRLCARRAYHVAVLGGAILLLGACYASFDIPATEVLNLRSGVVRDLDDQQQQVPERWDAEVVTRAPPLTLWVNETAGLQARSEESVRFSGPVEAGIGLLGTGLDASRGDRAKRPRDQNGPIALWLRDEGGHIVEIPLSSIDRVRVTERSERTGRGLSVGTLVAIIGASVLATGALVAGVLVVNMTNPLAQSD